MDGGAASWTPALIVTVALLFWAYSLYDLVRTDDGDVRTFPKPVWLVIVVLGSAVGGVAWWTLGRPPAARR